MSTEHSTISQRNEDRADTPGKPLRSELWIMAGLALYFLVVAPVYYFTTKEVAGGIALILSAGLFLILTVYLAAVGKEIGRLRPEDDKDGEIYQGAGELGFFPPQSIWPFWCALTVTVIFLGPVFGWWISLLGLGMGIWSVSGWVLEFYRGDYAH